MIKRLADREVQQFLRENENTDPFELSLKHKEVLGLAVDVLANQIISRKKARTKLPEWYQTEGVIFPPPLSMEQCSSEITAQNKASIISGDVLIDLTGGAGIDTYYLDKVFNKVLYVEQSQELCEIAAHNFEQLGAKNIRVVNQSAEEFINTYNKKATAIYIDPARRDEHKKKVYQWSDCQPDLPEIQNGLFKITSTILAKGSPMLDITASLKELDHVKEVHVISVKNECKEVLYLQKFSAESTVVSVLTKDFQENTDNSFDFILTEEAQARPNYAGPLKYLYEPNASLLKAGAFNILCDRFNVYKLHPQTHLYTSEKVVENFPGRKFLIKGVSSFNKKELSKWIPDKKANIAVRNFPQDVASIRKKTGITPGGNIYLFGTTLVDNKKVMLVCEKTIKNSL